MRQQRPAGAKTMSAVFIGGDENASFHGRPDVAVAADDRGRLLFAGLAFGSSWTFARGDYLYGPRHNADTDEWDVVRYRLVTLFD